MQVALVGLNQAGFNTAFSAAPKPTPRRDDGGTDNGQRTIVGDGGGRRRTASRRVIATA
jgi:hypothetical protein